MKSKHQHRHHSVLILSISFTWQRFLKGGFFFFPTLVAVGTLYKVKPELLVFVVLEVDGCLPRFESLVSHYPTPHLRHPP